MNAVYIRIFVYVLSAVLGLLPASWAGFAGFDPATGVLWVNIEGAATAIAAGLAASVAVFQRWGVK